MGSPGDEILYHYDGPGRALSILKELTEGRRTCVFQPIVTLASGKAEWYEVLMRLASEDDGAVSTDEFIYVAARLGVMPFVDRCGLASAVEVLTRHTDIKLMVNLHTQTLRDQASIDHLHDFVGRSNVERHRIGFEIKETSIEADPTRAGMVINGLHELGYVLALDDFGTGTSPLSHVSDLPFDYIKIDGRYIRDIDSEHSHRAFAKAVNAAAHTLGKKTVAEHVTTESVFGVVSNIGIDFGQGYYLGRPAPLASFTRKESERCPCRA